MDEKASRRRGQALEDAILDAAWDVLETGGWSGFTFGAVAERAHSSKPVLYRRWRTREELLAGHDPPPRRGSPRPRCPTPAACAGTRSRF